MRLPVNTITKRLFLSFGILVFNIIVISCLAMFFLWHTRTVSEIGSQIDNQRISITQLIGTDLDFLRFETVNHAFYESGTSPLLTKRDGLFKTIQIENKILHGKMILNEFPTDSQFYKIDTLLAQYSLTFQKLTRKIKERGFKDYGLEGSMRTYAHQLENMTSSVTLTELLMLRRHEKDFLLRKEENYIRLYNALAEELIEKIRSKHDQASLDVLQQYQLLFNQLTKVNFEIGVTPSVGLLGTLNTQTKLISAQLEQLAVLSAQRIAKVTQKSGLIFSVISFITIVFSTWLTYYTSTRLAHPIKKLSQSMGKFIVNEGLNEKDLENASETNEINALSQSFITLSRRLKKQFGEIQQQNKALKQLNEELDRFIYSAAHDLKSPLASMDGLIRLAEREINSAEYAHYFQMMSSSLRKLNGFIRDITDYAKNKRQNLKVEQVDLEELIRDTIESLRFIVNANHINVAVSIEGNRFFTDRTRLDIVFNNLISNSYRYLDSAKQESRIEIKGVVTEKHLRMTIKDNGIGIGENHLPKIFDMFYRAVEHSQGTGIGLFLVKESVKMLQGKIHVNSKLGEWTIFHVVLPNLRDESATVIAPQDGVHEEQPIALLKQKF